MNNVFTNKDALEILRSIKNITGEVSNDSSNVINVGSEYMADIQFIGKGRNIKALQATDGIVAQVVLTRKGRRPFSVKKFYEGHHVVPVSSGSIIAQIATTSGGMILSCCTVKSVQHDIVALSEASDDMVYDQIAEASDAIINACFAVMNGEEFAILKTHS